MDDEIKIREEEPADILRVESPKDVEVLKIDENGTVFVNGKKRFTDKELKEAFLKWFEGVDYFYKTTRLFQDLINTPTLKIPFWILQHKEELKKLGIFDDG
jgi:hypothetical protein